MCACGARDEKTKRCANENFAADEILRKIFWKIWIHKPPVLCDFFPPRCLDRQREKRERKPKTENKKTKPQTDLSSIPPSTISNPPHPPTKSNRNSEVHIEIQNRNDAPSALRRKKIEKTCINKERVNDKNTTTITIATTRNKTTTKKSISYSNHVAFHPLSAAVRSWHIRCECRAGEHLQLLLLPKSFGKLQL